MRMTQLKLTAARHVIRPARPYLDQPAEAGITQATRERTRPPVRVAQAPAPPSPVIPAKAAIQFAAASRSIMTVSAYWIVRFRGR
ncbi:hypothetical protein SSBR45G_39030 [Bradyrhizobium sp. SSBR45G]|nr:hypothetical protein SSBR45G_39030 [Bradyrhizobium sp. SSBR45G]GLH85317.1 hypothetical protein SSBR45R_27770 [Bradyrhizobium sp. SSBR45R]